jgi:hypothetical protein
MTVAPWTWASTVRGFTARLQCTPAVKALLALKN